MLLWQLVAYEAKHIFIQYMHTQCQMIIMTSEGSARRLVKSNVGKVLRGQKQMHLFTEDAHSM